MAAQEQPSTFTQAQVEAANRFMTIMSQFLSALKATWPDCPRVALYQSMWESKVAEHEAGSEGYNAYVQEAISGYHESMSPYYQKCERRDPSILNDNIDLLDNIDMLGKWNGGMHPTTLERMWQYLQILNGAAQEFMPSPTPDLATGLGQLADNIMQNVPEGIVQAAQQETERLEQMQREGRTPNLSDMMQIGFNTMQNIDPQDFQRMAQSIAGGQFGNAADIMAMASQAMGALQNNGPK